MAEQDRQAAEASRVTESSNALEAANSALRNARTAIEETEAWQNVTVVVETGEPGGEAEGTLNRVESGMCFHFVIPAGRTGAVPEVEIGTVTTLDSDESAFVRIEGTPEHPILNLGIPRGLPGTGNVSTVNGLGPDDSGNVQVPVPELAVMDRETIERLTALQDWT